METKKHPKADVRRNSSIYFAVGLVLMLLASNYFINYRTYDKEVIDLAQLNLGDIDDEEIPLTEHVKTPPPQLPPPVIPKDPEIIENDKDVEETIFDDTETDEDDAIADIEDIADDVVDEEEDIPVPFAFIEHVPEFPGCERKKTNKEKRKCMSDKITKLVQRKFNAELASDLGLTGKQRIHVVFKIDKQGKVVGVQSRAPHPRLQKEAARVVNLLPQMKPGKQRGVPVTVTYTLPIVFQVQD